MKTQFQPFITLEDEFVRKTGNYIRNLFAWDPSTSVKLSVSYGMCIFALKGLGSERHNRYLDDILEHCVCIIFIIFIFQ